MSEEEKIKTSLNLIRPYLNSDGGDVEFIKYEDGYLYIKLHGACDGCSFAGETIQDGILASIKMEVPEIKDIILVEL